MYVQLNFLCLYITHTYRTLTNIGNATVKSDVKLVFVCKCIILFVSLSFCCSYCVVDDLQDTKKCDKVYTTWS